MTKRLEITIDNFEEYYWKFVDASIFIFGNYFNCWPNDFIKSIKIGMFYRKSTLFTRIKKIKLSDHEAENISKEIIKRMK